MSDRRDFLKRSALAAAGLLVMGVGKGTASAAAGKFPEGIIYTKDQTGMWAGKEGSHAPEVKVDGLKVTVTTNHPMSAAHYIVRHTLVSAEGKVLGSKSFAPTDEKAVSTYELEAYHSSVLYATSFCNLHDLWVTEFTA